MQRVARKTDYLFQRPGSANWWIKLRSDGKRIERSLGTADKAHAEVLAGPMITAHKAALLAARPRVETLWVHEFEPGREHIGPHGGRIIATDKELIHMGHNGSVSKIEPNGGFVSQIVGRGALSAHLEFTAFDAAEKGFTGPVDQLRRPTASTKNSDDLIIQTYLDHGGKNNTGIHGHSRSEVETVWATFKRLTNNKRLKDCTREDGRLLVKHYQAEGLRSATIAKKITWLNAAVSFAIKESRFNTINPFSGIAPRKDAKGNSDKQDRVPLSEDNVKVCKRNLSKLSDEDQLLFRLLGSTGMRLGEAFQIAREEPTNGGPRFAIVGTKTDQSLRRVPFPADVLPYLPKSIKGQLFELLPPSARQTAIQRSAAAASKRLNRFLREIGIIDPAKVVHSLRHRAEDRLRDADCPEKISNVLTGHSGEKTVADSYGKGFSTAKLKQWIDKIGF